MMANELTYLSSQIGNAHWYNRLCNRSLRIRKSSGMGAADKKTPMCTLYEMLCQSTSLFPVSCSSFRGPLPVERKIHALGALGGIAS